jgi:STE24 endopeptidase
MRPTRAKRSLFALLIGLALLTVVGQRRTAPVRAAAGDAGGGDGLYASEAERERALRYNRRREWLVLVGMGFTALINLVALVTGFSGWLRRRAERVAPPRLGPEVPYGLVAALLSSLVSLPLSYYGGWVVEQQYGLTNQTRRAWAAEQAKGTAIGLVLSLPILHAVYYVIRRAPRWWWAILSALTIPFTIILANLAPVLILPLFNKYEPIKDRALADRIKALAATQGVTVSDVLQMDMSKQTKKANAFFAGLGNTKRIVLADTLLNEFTPDEIEVVLAHELGHQVHGDIWKLIGLGALTSALTAWAVDRFGTPLIARHGGRFGLDPARGVGDIAALPLLSLLLNAISLLLLPLQNGISRNLIERPADRYALDLTNKREAFIGAMEKLGRMNLADPQPPALVKYFLHGHPTLQERIAFGREWEPGKQ